ncbi:hypothetical protein GCM10011413_34300 [Pedobacter psychrotolerans]|uniref:Uncharacterized protein n=1 Tax=Pedobacter psychrotolerans TaxID=1843235 RepID=A0ABQ1SU24_9SPHI|nr:hypothetical protein GCM10011413_34300 [Pedobacter psychrotolerans]
MFENANILKIISFSETEFKASNDKQLNLHKPQYLIAVFQWLMINFLSHFKLFNRTIMLFGDTIKI